MKRYPDGVRSEAFYQHRAPDKVPPGVRIEVLPDDDVPSRPVGGTLKTLLYLTQLAAISQDPWFSRVQSLHLTDHIAFDLDPMPGTSFETVLDVARWLRDELAKVGAVGVPKTSGSDGLHVFVPMPKQTPYETGRIWAQIVATIVATRHPQVATVERSVKTTRREGLRGLPTEHRGQDAGLRVQRARQRVCGGVDAADVGRGGRRGRPARLHDSHAAGAAGGGRGPLEGALEGEGAGFAEGGEAPPLGTTR